MVAVVELAAPRPGREGVVGLPDGDVHRWGCGHAATVCVEHPHCRAYLPQGGEAVQENFATILETVADVRAERIAVTHGDRRLTWRQLDDHAARLAGFLAAHGVQA